MPCCDVNVEADVSDKEGGGLLRMLLQNKIGPALTAKPLKIGLVVGFFAFFALMAYYASLLQQGWSWLDLVADDGPVREFFNVRQKFSSNFEYPMELILPPKQSWPAAAANVLAFQKTLADSEYIEQGSINSWVTTIEAAGNKSGLFKTFCASKTAVATMSDCTEAQFLLGLGCFLMPMPGVKGAELCGMGKEYGGDFKLQMASNGKSIEKVLEAKIRMKIAPKSLDECNSCEGDPLKKVDAVLAIRKLCDDKLTGSYPYSVQFGFWEQFCIIKKELVQNILLSLAAVFVLTLALVGHPVTSVFILMAVGMTVVDVMGINYLTGIHIDSISMVCLILAVGLAVDYASPAGRFRARPPQTAE